MFLHVIQCIYLSSVFQLRWPFSYGRTRRGRRKVCPLISLFLHEVSRLSEISVLTACDVFQKDTLHGLETEPRLFASPSRSICWQARLWRIWCWEVESLYPGRSEMHEDEGCRMHAAVSPWALYLGSNCNRPTAARIGTCSVTHFSIIILYFPVSCLLWVWWRLRPNL